MASQRWTASILTGACAVVVCAGVFTSVSAQQPPAAAQGGRGGGRGGAGMNVFTAADENRDGFVTRDELRATFAKWVGSSGSATQEQLASAISAAFPQSTAPPRAAAQNQTPNPADVEKMKAALPDKAPAKPKRPRKVLVLSKAAGFVHSCIPLVATTMEKMGTKTKAWTATVTYDPAAITAENLKQYDLLFLNNTTGAFLDDPNDAAATAARKKALLEFVRSGKGLAGIHAAGDSYHEAKATTPAPAPTGGGRGPGSQLAGQLMRAGDSNQDQKLSREEAIALADSWYAKLDTTSTGKLSQADFGARFASLLPPNPAPAGRGPGGPQTGRPGKDPQVGTWLEFNKMIGGFFKYHWNDPQLITVKIDDPKSPVTAMFQGKEFDINDETYTFGQEVWSRTNLHVLTSVDYDKMSAADKAKEDYPRPDHDYGLSWIRREGKGRIFYEAHGHSERVYAMKPMLEHVLAGVQYAMGDLNADDSPSVKK
jgi:type 1 glutamine amidotransferase